VWRDPVMPPDIAAEVTRGVDTRERHHLFYGKECPVRRGAGRASAQVAEVARGWNAGFAAEQVREPGRREVDGGSELEHGHVTVDRLFHTSDGMGALGRLGGLKGGPARAAALSPKRRRAIAKAAASARWRK
jgi:hypothetical protein